MTSARHKKTRPGKPLSSWKLSVASLTELRTGWKRYTLILAIIAVPSDLIGFSGGAGPVSVVGAYLLMASIIMNVALIWAMVQREQTGVIPRPSAAYYDGSIMIVRFMVVALALLAMTAPAALGAVLFTRSQEALVATSASLGEQALIGFVCSLFAIPSAWLLTRFGLSSTAVIASNLRPLAALRYARQLTIGHFWRLAGRYLGLLLLVIVISIPVTLAAALLMVLKLPFLAVLFFQLATTFIVLPLTNWYLLYLYRDLEPKPVLAP